MEYEGAVDDYNFGTLLRLVIFISFSVCFYRFTDSIAPGTTLRRTPF